MYQTFGHSGTDRRRESSDVRTAELSQAGAEIRRRAEQSFWAVDLKRAVGWLRRGTLVIVASALVVAGLAVGVSLYLKPRFVAEAAVLIDPSNLQVVADDIYSQSQQRDSQLLEVESMIGVLTSGNTLRRVVATLQLGADPEFAEPTGLLSAIEIPFGSGDSDAAGEAPEVTALKTLQARVKAARENGSFIVNVSLWAQSPEKSVQLVDALVAAFQAELSEQEASGAERAAGALSEQLAELKESARVAEDAVEGFKRDNNLQWTNGELINAQSLTQLNGQVLEAQNRVIAAESRYEELVAQGRSGANAGALQSATMTALRTQYAALRQEYDSAALTLGPRHPRLMELGPQVSALESQIAAETERSITSAKADVDAARSELDALNGKAAQLQQALTADNQAQVTLRELEREADSATAIYEAFLTRAVQVAEREGIDTTNVRVISPAVQPTRRSWPPGPLLSGVAGILAGLGLGMVLAACLGLARDYRRARKGALG